jgi:hypothetical protein
VDARRPFTFLSLTDQESSLVCPTERVPENTLKREDGWSLLRVVGPLDFSLIGILARIAAVLAEAGISIFAISTFDTDYLMVKQDTLQTAEKALRAHGYALRSRKGKE